MSSWTPRIDQVRYNAAEQCFEALVTVVTPHGLLRVASQYVAPISTDFETAARGLWMRARLRLGTPEMMRLRLPGLPEEAVFHEQAKPEQAKPEQAKPEQAKPEQAQSPHSQFESALPNAA
jgi:hypothetical protein